jgi:hydroxyethylthiazole kinase-like uncharacterized protein yjeF
MIPILTLSEMREVERQTVAGGITEFDLILSAGEAVYQSIKTLLDASAEDVFETGLPQAPPEEDPGPGDKYEPPKPPTVAFVCGKGHNGADGLAAAIRCAHTGLGVVVYHIYADRYSAETRRLRDQLAMAEIPVHSIRSAVDLPVFEDADLIVDALLGSGLSGATEALMASVIHGVNASDRPVLSIDVPSGISCDAGEIQGPAVHADSTLCLGALKPSALFFPSGLAFGKVGYSPVAFEEKRLFGQPSNLSMFTWDDALDLIPIKTWRTHKYTAGKVLIIAGSRGMHGAAALCANAALRSGAGLVRAAVPAGIHRDATPHLLEIIGTPLGEDADYHFTPSHLPELTPWLEWADAIVVGPGLGKHPDTLAFLHGLLPLLKGRRVVVDGDAQALFLVGNPPVPEGGPGFENFANFVLTPHAGEYHRMGGLQASDASVALIEDARAFAARWGVTLVLKGPTTICARAAGGVTLSASGNPGMATAGTGDVLAGILGRMLAVLPPGDAAPLTVFLHGRAGDAARRDRGTSGMTASDLILYLPLAMKELEDALAADADDDEDDEDTEDESV